MRNLIKINLLCFIIAMVLNGCTKEDENNNVNTVVFENKLLKSALMQYKDGTKLLFTYKYDDQKRLIQILYGPKQTPLFDFSYDIRDRISSISAYQNFFGNAKYVLTYDGNSNHIAKFSKQNFQYNTLEEIVPNYDSQNHTVTYIDKAGAKYNIKTDTQEKVITFFEKAGTKKINFQFEYDMNIATGLINTKTSIMIPLYIVAGDYVNMFYENQPLNVITNFAIKNYLVTDDYNLNKKGYMENTKTTGNLLEKSRIFYNTNSYYDVMFSYE